MSKIEIEISGNSDELSKEIVQAKKDLRSLEKEKETRVKIGADTSDLDKRISEVKRTMSTLDTQLTKTTQATQNFSKATANGGNTLTQFSRIAQDAPFGIIGIGNNLTATAEAFGNLSKSSGGAVNALKAVGASLLGSGGVLLAISLVTTGLTYMAQSGLTIGDVMDKLTGKFDAVGRAMSEAFAEAAKNSASEISQMKAFVNVASDVNLSMQKRLLAVDKLQKDYPAYFGNLTKEQILNGEVSTAVKGLTNALIAKAKAQAFSNRIAELAEKSLQNDLKAVKLREDLLKLEGQLAQAQNNKAAAQFGGATAEAAGIQAVISRIETQKKAIYDLIKLNKENARIMAIYTGEIEDATAASILLEQKTPKEAKDKKTKTPKLKTPQFDPSGKYLIGLNQQIQDEVNNFDWSAVEVEPPMQLKLTGVQEEFLRLQGLVTAFSQEMDSLITDSVSNGLGNLGNSIGEALANGGNVLNAVGNSLLQSLGKFLSDMGGLLIKYGTLALIKGKLDIAIATGGPVAIGAGLAAIAVGIALKAAGGAIGARAKQGGIGGGGSTNSGNNSYTPSSTVSTGGGSGFQNGSVVFEISGNSLIGVLSNTLDKNSRLGGTLGIN